MSRANRQRSRLCRPYPSSWPSTEHDYLTRLKNVTERLDVGRSDSTFLQYVNSQYVDSRWTNGYTVVPFGVPEPLTYRDQQQAPLKRIAVYPKVQRSDEHLKRTRSDNITPLPIEPKAKCQTTLMRIWMSARSQIGALRDRILAERIEVKREKSWYHQHEEEFNCIRERFMDMIYNIDPHSRAALHRLSKELEHRQSDLNTVRGRLAALENNLSNHEYQLQRLEENVYFELDKESRQDQLSFGPHVQSSSVHTIIPSDSGFDERTGLRDRLYSRMGDLRIHLERLNNFEFDLRRELEERDFVRASGQADIIPDAQFFEQTKADREMIQRDLEDAQVDVRELKEQCSREGIDFEEPELPDILYHTETESDALTFDSPMYQPDVQPGSSSIIGAFFNAQERVKKWLKEPSGLPTMENEGTPEIPDNLPKMQSLSSDRGWVLTPNPPQRAAATETVREHGSAALSGPEWRFGPLPGSSHLEALLLESATTPLEADGSQS